MTVSHTKLVVLLAALALLAACGNEAVDAPALDTEPVVEVEQVSYEYLEQEIPPCTPVEDTAVDPCEQGVGQILLAKASRDAGVSEPHSIRYLLDGGISSGVAVGHVVVRATYLPNSVRCEATRTFRRPAWWGWPTPEKTIATGLGLIQCFADIRANAYIVGSGPSTMPVMLARINYWDETVADEDIEDEVRGIEGAFRTGDTRNRYRVHVPARGIEGREVVLFLSPATDHSFEVWQARTTWNVQRNDDGSVVVRHPNAELWLDSHPAQAEVPLATFITSVQAAHTARMTEYGGKIRKDDPDIDNDDLPTLVTDANMLNSYHVEVGNTTHTDGPPEPPPPVREE